MGPAYAQQRPVGAFQDHADIGNPKLKGATAYDAGSQVYTLKGAGYNIWFGRDEFHYAYNKLSGDFILTAQFEFVGKGWMPTANTAGWCALPNRTMRCI
jgi:TolB protein